MSATQGPSERSASADVGSGSDLSEIYRLRFSDEELAFKRAMWTVLCERVFSHYVGPSDTVLDLGAGSCEFINAIACGRKIAVDLNPETIEHADDAEVILTRSDEMGAVADDSVDVVFTSNFFEHLPDKRALVDTLAECVRVIRPGGRIVVLMPNIRYLNGRYWDYFDHHLPLTHLSLCEALALAGFRMTRVVPRFLPYTVKSNGVPKSTVLLRAYLSFRPAWRIFGRQMLVVATLPTASRTAIPSAS